MLRRAVFSSVATAKTAAAAFPKQKSRGGGIVYRDRFRTPALPNDVEERPQRRVTAIAARRGAADNRTSRRSNSRSTSTGRGNGEAAGHSGAAADRSGAAAGRNDADRDRGGNARDRDGDRGRDGMPGRGGGLGRDGTPDHAHRGRQGRDRGGTQDRLLRDRRDRGSSWADVRRHRGLCRRRVLPGRRGGRRLRRQARRQAAMPAQKRRFFCSWDDLLLRKKS